MAVGLVAAPARIRATQSAPGEGTADRPAASIRAVVLASRIMSICGRTASIELHQFTGRVLASAPRWSRGSKIDQIRDWLRTGFVRRVNGQPVDDLAILHDVADAFKHAQLTRKAWFLETDRAVIRTATGFGRLSCGEGKFGGAEQVIVELLDGRQRALSLILWTVRDAWAAAMGKPRRLFT